MDFQRAQQILSSEKTIPVFHKGAAIWIEKLDSITQSALVTSNEKQMNVAVTDLTEGMIH